MLQTPHVAVGAAIAVGVTNPYIAIPMALGSHFVLDMIPHWNPHTYTEAVKHGIPTNPTITLTLLDISTALGLGLWIAYSSLPNTTLAITIVLASFASVLPDVIKYPFFLFKKIRKGKYKKYVDFERSLQNDVEMLPGVLTQLLIAVAALYWIFG